MDNMYSLSDISAVTGRDGFGGGNSAWVLIILFALIFGWGGMGVGNRGFCNNGSAPVTESNLCNSMNFNNLENAVGRMSDQQAAIARQTDNGICNLGYENLRNFNALSTQMAQSDNAIQTQLAECCCTTQRGIDNVNYNAAMNTASINAVTTAQTQKILDAIAGNRMADMQNQINQLQLQSALCGVVRYPNATTYSAGPYAPYYTSGCCATNI